MDPTLPSGRLRERGKSGCWLSWELGALLAAAAVGYAAYQLMPVPDATWQRRVALALDDSTDVYLPFRRAMLQPVASLDNRFAPARFLFRALPAAIGFLYPAANLSGVARRAERPFAWELPDAVQILSLLVPPASHCLRPCGDCLRDREWWLRGSGIRWRRPHRL